MYLTCDKGYSNTLASLVNKIDDDTMACLYGAVETTCMYNSGRCPKLELSNISDIGPRLIQCTKYQNYKQRLSHLQKEPSDLLAYADPDVWRAYLNDRNERLKVAYNDVWNIENLCFGFGYTVDDWLNKYHDDLANPTYQFDLVASPESEALKFKSFLLDCASYVDFYYSKVTNKAFCNDVFEYYQGLLPESQLPSDPLYGYCLAFEAFVCRLIVCASMLYKLSNDRTPCKYDGQFKIDCDVSFRLDVSGYPKGLYRTKTALKVFEVISLLWS